MKKLLLLLGFMSVGISLIASIDAPAFAVALSEEQMLAVMISYAKNREKRNVSQFARELATVGVTFEGTKFTDMAHLGDFLLAGTFSSEYPEAIERLVRVREVADKKLQEGPLAATEVRTIEGLQHEADAARRSLEAKRGVRASKQDTLAVLLAGSRYNSLKKRITALKTGKKALTQRQKIARQLKASAQKRREAAAALKKSARAVTEPMIEASVESIPTHDTDAAGIVSALVEEMITSIEKEKNQNEEKVAAPKLTPTLAPAIVPIAVMERVPNPLPLMPAVRSPIAVNSPVVPVVVALPKLLPEPQPVTTTQPIVVPVLTEEEANTLNTVLLRASGIVMMTPALVYLMYLLVAKRIVPQYEQLAAIVQSREVRSRLTSLRRIEAIAAALAPVLLATGSAMVYAGS
ncbi:MAG: hypothetical protein QG604_940 [Candidatus Dependentiae bacterium]|nr:hypothetical protein [Candidatus Dependentiae bacterium]